MPFHRMNEHRTTRSDGQRESWWMSLALNRNTENAPERILLNAETEAESSKHKMSHEGKHLCSCQGSRVYVVSHWVLLVSIWLVAMFTRNNKTPGPSEQINKNPMWCLWIFQSCVWPALQRSTDIPFHLMWNIEIYYHSSSAGSWLFKVTQQLVGFMSVDPDGRWLTAASFTLCCRNADQDGPQWGWT